MATELQKIAELTDEVERLRAIVDSPDPRYFFWACEQEARYQRVKWPGPQGFDPSAFGSSDDQDYVFLCAYLCGGAAKTPDGEPGSPERLKKLHRITAAAAALANWHEEVKNRDLENRVQQPGVQDSGTSE